MSSTGPSANDNAAAATAKQPVPAANTALPNSASSNPAANSVPRSEPIMITPSFQAARSQARPMASSAPGRFTWERADIAILGSSPPDKDKGRPKNNKW